MVRYGDLLKIPTVRPVILLIQEFLVKKLLALSLILTLPTGLGAFTPPDPGSSFIYPSPVQGGACATLAYNMAESGTARILIYGESGDLVDRVVETKPAGVSQSQVCTYTMAAGVFFYRVLLTYDSGRQEKLPVGRFLVMR